MFDVVIGKRYSGKTELAKSLTAGLTNLVVFDPLEKSLWLNDDNVATVHPECATLELLAACPPDCNLVFDNAFCERQTAVACMADPRTAVVTVSYPVQVPRDIFRRVPQVHVLTKGDRDYARLVYCGYVSRVSGVSFDDYLRDPMNTWRRELSEEVIKSVFVRVDPRFGGPWGVPYKRVRDRVSRMSDDYWAQHPGVPRSGGGLVCLAAPSMDEYALETERIARECVEELGV